jgi:phosphatidylglycerophosphate synthase
VTFAAMMDKLPKDVALWAGTVAVFMAVIALSLTMSRFGKLWMGRDKPSDVAANYAGKAKLVCETVGLSACLIGLATASPMLAPIGMTLLTLALGLAFLSLVGQLR